MLDEAVVESPHEPRSLFDFEGRFIVLSIVILSSRVELLGQAFGPGRLELPG